VCSVGTKALSHFVDTSRMPIVVTYNLLLKILHWSSAFTGLGIIAYNILLCRYEITLARSKLLHDTKVRDLMAIGKGGHCFVIKVFRTKYNNVFTYLSYFCQK